MYCIAFYNHQVIYLKSILLIRITQFSYERLWIDQVQSHVCSRACIYSVLILSGKNVSFPQKSSLMESGEI